MLEGISKKKFLLFKTFLIAFLPVLLLILIFPYVFLGQKVFIGDWHDILANTMPYHFLKESPLSLWNNAWITGFPEIAAPMSDRFYPFSFPAFYITGDIYIINWVLIGHLVVAYITSFVLFSLVKRDYNLPISIIALFSLLYMASGAMLARIMAGHIFIVYALAWIPLLYYAYFCMVRYSERTVTNILVFVIASLLILFSASVYYLFFAYVFIFIMLGFEYLETRRWQLALPVLIGIGVFLLMGSVKILPDLFMQEWIVRQDPIDPLSNGGSLESTLASIIFGTSITKGYEISGLIFGFHESIVLIGAIPLFFIILGFVYGEKKWTLPAFLSVIVAIIWADGGKTLLSFLHFLPIVESFRCPGRILAPLIPLLILIGIQGFAICLERFKGPKKFSLSSEQKRLILYGAGTLILIKITEIPFQEAITIESWLSLIFLFLVLGLLYYNHMSPRISLIILVFFLGVNAFGIGLNHPILSGAIPITSVCIGVILAVTLFSYQRDLVLESRMITSLFILLLLGIALPIAGSISHLSPTDPKLDESPALELIGTLQGQHHNTTQVWVMTTGQSYYYLDYTYWLIRNGFHPTRAYYAYYLEKSADYVYEIGNDTYYTADFIVDVQALNSGETVLPVTSFTSTGIPVFQPQRVLPNVFILRNSEMIPLTADVFNPDLVIVKHDFQKDDIVILKYSYFKGWKANQKDTVPVGNLIGYRITGPINQVAFQFESYPFVIGIFMCVSGCIFLFFLLFKKDFLKFS